MALVSTQAMDSGIDQTILIVDDDVDMAEALEEYLAPHGFTVRLSHDLAHAEQVVTQDAPKVVLLDVRLGPEFGLDLISRVRPKHPELLFIVMTAFADTDVAIQALKRGAYDFVRKPVDPAALSRTIRRLFDSLRIKAEREDAMHQLARSEANMRMAQRMGAFGSWEVELDSGTAFWSEEQYEIFGVDADTFTPTLEAFEAFIHPDDLERMRESYREMETAAGPVNVEYRILRPDGSLRTLQSAALAGRGPDGKVQRRYGIVQDITERLKLEQQLRQAQKMEAVGQLAGGVAHEFNNLLQVIRGYTELALKRCTGDDRVQADLQRVLTASDAASQMAWRLLRFSRKEALRPLVLDVNDLIQNLMQMVRKVIGEVVGLDLQLGEGVPPIKADPGLLDQVIMNLCVNARDAMPDGGKLVIATQEFEASERFCEHNQWARPTSYAVISVTDNGTGMTPEVRARLFEPFFTTKSVGQGTGLGLSIVYGIVEQHDGHIDVYSEEHLGTTIRIYLPATQDSHTVPAPRTVATEAPGGSELLLVAEDEPSVLELLTHMLEDKGYRVIQAADGVEAIQKWKEHRDEIRLAMLDVIMPRQSGRDTFEQIRALGGTIPVVFSTGYTGAALDPEVLAQQDVYVVNKPYSPNMLYEQVRNALDRDAP